MPVSICPRCKHINPDYASYCYFDGIALQAQQNAVVHRLPGDFVFPSGRRCTTFDELAQGCQEEWAAARDLLQRGVFAQFFQKGQRADLMRAALDAKAQTNADVALMTFLAALPGTRTQSPKLDLHPRRILLGKMTVGESKTVSLTITNQAQGVLQGTVTITEGQDWLSLSASAPVHELAVNAVREQIITLSVHTKGIAAGQPYGARLTVVTNGGVVEVPLRLDLMAQPYPRAPFQGVRTQRELAEKMRQQAKAAVPVLESGDVQRWFALNGWTYPISGPPVKGVGGVQQFFEGMGLSKPPLVTLSQYEFHLTCKYQESLRAQVTLQTKQKKWVYAQAVSDQPWLKVLHPSISGPQHATVPLEIDTHLWNQGPSGEGNVSLIANGGQKLALKVHVAVQGSPNLPRPKPSLPRPPAPAAVADNPFATLAESLPPHIPLATHSPRAAVAPAGMPSRSKIVPALTTTVLLCVLLRLLLVPLVDLGGRASVVTTAVSKMGIVPSDDSPFEQAGGWLRLPWLAILGGSDGHFSADLFQPGNSAEINIGEFRHYFASYFLRWFILRTWWIGALLGAILVRRRGGTMADLPWGIIAGSVAGATGAATLAAFFLVAELLPHTLWHLTFSGHGGIGYLLAWSLLAVFSWLLLGIVLGIVLPWITPLRRVLVDPFQHLLARGLALMGMKALAEAWSPG